DPVDDDPPVGGAAGLLTVRAEAGDEVVLVRAPGSVEALSGQPHRVVGGGGRRRERRALVAAGARAVVARRLHRVAVGADRAFEGGRGRALDPDPLLARGRRGDGGGEPEGDDCRGGTAGARDRASHVLPPCGPEGFSTLPDRAGF